jgi:diguanylate cyclase (GGDEF)-like protein
VLRDTAWVLRTTLREADVLGRVGGDEFIVLSTGGDADGLAEQLARIQSALSSFNDTHTRPYRLEVSCGMAWAGAADTYRFDYLMTTADKAMYDEKQRRQAAR